MSNFHKKLTLSVLNYMSNSNTASISFLSLYLIFIYSSTVFAHPVSFEGGTMFTSSYSKNWIEQELNYTFSPSSSFGLNQFRITEKDETRDYLIPRLSERFRKNSLDYQANLYLTAGLGSRIDEDSSRLSKLIGIQVDYETRRIYTLGLAESIIDNDAQPRTHLQYRLGFAPYKSNFHEVATWLITQFDYRPFKDDKISVTPILRFFYQNLLFEVGYDLDRNISTTFMMNY